MECEFCKKSFSSKNTLGTHQKTTKRCLEIQKNLKENEAKKNEEKTKTEDNKEEKKEENPEEIDIETKCKKLEEENQRLKNRIKEKDEGYGSLINRILYEKNTYIQVLESKLRAIYEKEEKERKKAESREEIDMIDLVHGYLALIQTGVDNHGDSVLIWASRFNQDDMVKTLVERGANINEPAKSDGRTALDIWEKKCEEMSEFLREHGAKKRCELDADSDEDSD